MFPPPTPRMALSLASLRRRWPYEPRKRKQGHWKAARVTSVHQKASCLTSKHFRL